MTPIGPGLPVPATLFFNQPIRALLPQINREPININTEGEHYEALKAHQDKYLKGSDTHKDSLSFPIGSTVTLQWEDGGPWMYGLISETDS